jgi:hypothetical protein
MTLPLIIAECLKALDGLFLEVNLRGATYAKMMLSDLLLY